MPADVWGEIELPEDPIPIKIEDDTGRKIVMGTGLTVSNVEVSPDGVTVSGRFFPAAGDKITMSLDTSTIDPDTMAIMTGARPWPDGSDKTMADPEPDAPPEAISESLTSVYEAAEVIKRDLADRGWSYEAAEDIAATYIKEAIATIIRGIYKT